MLRYLIAGTEVGLSHGAKNYVVQPKRSVKKPVENYRPLSALNHRITVKLYAWCAAEWKTNFYLPLCGSDKFTKL
jgi:hypothetical protein